MGGRSVAAALFVLPIALPGQLLIRQLHVQGNVRLKEAAIIAASGLKLNATIAPNELNAAGQRLFDTGLFTGVNYKYAPLGADRAAGQTVTLIVAEEAAKVNVVLDIAGMGSEALWKELTGDTSLLARVVPASPAAGAYYVSVIEAALAKEGHAQKLATDDEGDLGGGSSRLVIRPMNRPAVADLAFTGNTAISSAVLRDRIIKITVGNPFSEREYRRILESNLGPMFEEKGLLKVGFPAVRAEVAGGEKVMVTASIDEGRVWTLGKVTLEGDQLPVEAMLKEAHFASGRVANWKEFLAGVESAQKVLLHDGYLGLRSEPVRSFQDGSGVVDVALKIRKGKQFHFASLDVVGLTDSDRAKAMSAWKLKSGDPMDAPYVGEYAKPLFSGPAKGKKSVSPEMRVREGTTDVDVIVTFK